MFRRQFMVIALAPALLPAATPDDFPQSDRCQSAAKRVLGKLTRALSKKNLAPGMPLYLRFFKESSEMEMWMLPPGTLQWQLFKTWPVAKWSGSLGPKRKTGDLQTPEGIYHTDVKSLNPLSNYHLSFNINYPNKYDLDHGSTGNYIMVHGSDVSIGCYAMTDPAIDEIYTLVVQALKAGQPTIPIHCFPFRMTKERMDAAEANPAEKSHFPFWQELAPAYALFETTRVLPRMRLKDKRYEFSSGE